LSVKIIRAFSGTHGTGKTTSAYHQANQEKMFNPGKSVHALCNLEAFSPWPINRDGSEQTQAWLFANQIKQEISAMRRFDVVVTDRTVVDVIAYTRCLGFHSQADGMMAYAEHHIQYYSSIHVKCIRYNKHHHPDGIRDMDEAFRQDVENTLVDIYQYMQDQGMIPGGLYFV
jgi:hypothetical protein